MRGLRGDRPLRIYSLDVFYGGGGGSPLCKPGRDDLIHAATYATALADGVLLYILRPYHAQLYRKVPVLLPLLFSLLLLPGLTLCTDQQQQQQQQPAAPGAIWNPPHTGPPQLHRTALGLQTCKAYVTLPLNVFGLSSVFVPLSWLTVRYIR